MVSVVETMTFETWSKGHPPRGLRYSQHLFNTAPEHIQTMTRGVQDLDPFYVDSTEKIYILNNFLLFASLVWDVTDEYELRVARRMVMSEPNARR